MVSSTQSRHLAANRVTVGSRELGAPITDSGSIISARAKTMSGNTLRQFVGAFQRGDKTAYRDFLRSTAEFIEMALLHHLEPCQRKIAMGRILNAIHRKRATCDPRSSAREWILGIGSYELRKLDASIV